MADNDYKLPRRLSLAGPRRPAISSATVRKNPMVEGAESATESRFSKPPEEALGDLEKG
jgi:hypothetical protein